ncbi:hypothetical protein EOD42_16575 [Rhodovarius crocodyli]|uniref:Uncharacterized protein n=1 Tax=Rhodovarius crocodyli TaxID=1979269 RepID=A0A437MDS6_9PROT|nr:hypothetical protein [Rhodovarius crocodyli]RVT95802.1 hypothetical protein EOD42_16575 [Rhodovarius crocodyli]
MTIDTDEMRALDSRMPIVMRPTGVQRAAVSLSSPAISGALWVAVTSLVLVPLTRLNADGLATLPTNSAGIMEYKSREPPDLSPVLL